jgi:hypothetical protein
LCFEDVVAVPFEDRARKEANDAFLRMLGCSREEMLAGRAAGPSDVV